MPIFNDHRWALALLFITPLLWSVNSLVGRMAPGIIAPHMLALLRWTLAGLVLLPFAWSELLAKRSSVFKNAWHHLVFGALGMWICGAWVYIGARSTDATNIALIYALSPVFIALVSSLWLRVRLGCAGFCGPVAFSHQRAMGHAGASQACSRCFVDFGRSSQLDALFHFSQTLANRL